MKPCEQMSQSEEMHHKLPQGIYVRLQLESMAF